MKRLLIILFLLPLASKGQLIKPVIYYEMRGMVRGNFMINADGKVLPMPAKPKPLTIDMILPKRKKSQ